MTISHEFILTLQKLRGFGPKKIETIAQAISESQFKAMSLEELYDVLVDLHKAGRLKGISSLPDYEDLDDANRRACYIIRKSEDMGIKMVSRYDSDFPSNLLNTVNEKGKLDVPILLYYKGDLSITTKPAIAIIGTREPSPQGRVAGEKFGEFFASHGFNIVSGLAVGCDTAGHRGALKSAAGATTAFLAHGLDTVYPPERESYAKDPSNNSSLVTAMRHGECSFLFTGDAESARLQELVEEKLGQFDFLQVPHHGVWQTQLISLLNMVQPEAAVITSSEKEPEDQATVSLLEKYAGQILLTREGEVDILSDGSSLSVCQEIFAAAA